ncbi:MAG: hypothetical protein ABI551_26315 [Polyangiaceae bacterium]
MMLLIFGLRMVIGGGVPLTLVASMSLRSTHDCPVSSSPAQPVEIIQPTTLRAKAVYYGNKNGRAFRVELPDGGRGYLCDDGRSLEIDGWLPEDLW